MENKTKSNTTQRDVVSVQVGTDLTVQVIPNTEHEFLMTTKELSLKLKVAESNLRGAKSNHSDELLEGIHFVKRVDFMDESKNLQLHQTLWTKIGLIRLAYYLHGGETKKLRDWAEKIIMEATKNSFFPFEEPKFVSKNKANLFSKIKIFFKNIF